MFDHRKNGAGRAGGGSTCARAKKEKSRAHRCAGGGRPRYARPHVAMASRQSFIGVGARARKQSNKRMMCGRRRRPKHVPKKRGSGTGTRNADKSCGGVQAAHQRARRRQKLRVTRLKLLFGQLRQIASGLDALSSPDGDLLGLGIKCQAKHSVKGSADNTSRYAVIWDRKRSKTC
jgi:hypothetical protein